MMMVRGFGDELRVTRLIECITLECDVLGETLQIGGKR